jgi:hypothetical protein
MVSAEPFGKAQPPARDLRLCRDWPFRPHDEDIRTKEIAMATVAISRRPAPPLHAALSRSERHHVVEWYAAGGLVAFAIPLVAANLLELHHDLFLLVYFTLAGTFLASFAAHARVDWRGWLRTRMWWSIGVGAAVAFAIVRRVLTEASMAHPSGGFFWFEVARRAVRDDGCPAVVRVPGDGGVPGVA